MAYSQIGCLVVACATFGLRVMIRVRQKRPLMDSDWVVLAALGTFAVYVGVTLAGRSRSYTNDSMIANVCYSGLQSRGDC